MHMELVLGIDLGTSYFKLGLFDRTGRLRGLGRVPVPADTADGTHCELAIDHFWSTLRTGLEQALRQAEAGCADICAVAYSSQANSFALFDERFEPLTPLILWPDTRAQPIDPAVEALWSRGDFLSVTGVGIPLCPELAVAKLCWLRQESPRLWAVARHIMTISDYLTFALTGRNAGDAGTAGLLGLQALEKETWWGEALALLDIAPDRLPELLRPGSVAGDVRHCGTKRLGLRSGIPFAVGSLDHHVAALGAGLGSLAAVSESTGTVLACLNLSSRIDAAAEVCCGPDFAPDRYYRLAFDGSGASVLEWYRDTHAPDLTIDELVRLAENVPPGCEGLVARPSANRYPALEGFLHVDRRHTPGHFARAIMEATTRALERLVDGLLSGQRPARILATGGGARSDLWLQAKANRLGCEFVRPACRESACFGAAMLAATAKGWFADCRDAGRAWVEIHKTFEPAASA